MTGNTINDITEIVLNCEAIQQSNESEFTKEQAKLASYDEIRAVIVLDQNITCFCGHEVRKCGR